MYGLWLYGADEEGGVVVDMGVLTTTSSPLMISLVISAFSCGSALSLCSSTNFPFSMLIQLYNNYMQMNDNKHSCFPYPITASIRLALCLRMSVRMRVH